MAGNDLFIYQFREVFIGLANEHTTKVGLHRMQFLIGAFRDDWVYDFKC